MMRGKAWDVAGASHSGGSLPAFQTYDEAYGGVYTYFVAV